MFELKIGKGSAAEHEEPRETRPEEEETKCTFGFLRRVLEGVSELVKQLEVKASPEGVAIQAMDTMQVSMVDIFLKNSAFESFRCDRDIVLGIPLPYLLKIFKNLPVDSSSSVLLSANDDATTLLITTEEHGKKYSHKMNLLALRGSDGYNLPRGEVAAQIVLAAPEFHRISKTLGAFGEVLKIEATERGFVFMQKSDMGDSEISFAQNEGGENSARFEYKVNVSEPQAINIPARFLGIFGKFVGSSGEVSIELAPNKPIYMTSKMAFGYLNYYIAPRDES